MLPNKLNVCCDLKLNRGRKLKVFYYFKYLIQILSIAILFHFSNVRANIIDGGEIQFNGSVSDESPKWKWQINSPSQSWAVNTGNARLENGVLIFDLREKGVFPFLEGHLNEIAERGGPGFIPMITFSSAGQPLSVIKGGNSTSQHFRACVPVSGSDSKKLAGKFCFTVEQAMAINLGPQQEFSMPVGVSFVSGHSVTNVQPKSLPDRLTARLSSLLLMNKGSSVTILNKEKTINQEVLANSRLMNFSTAYASELSDFELRLPIDEKPSQWHVKLNVTVTIQ